jgi:hypothetical protein
MMALLRRNSSASEIGIRDPAQRVREYGITQAAKDAGFLLARACWQSAEAAGGASDADVAEFAEACAAIKEQYGIDPDDMGRLVLDDPQEVIAGIQNGQA